MRFVYKLIFGAVVERWWGYIDGNPDTVAYGFWRSDLTEFVYNGDHVFPVASAIKIYHLLVYAVSVVAGVVDPQEKIAVSEWEKYYFPIDGGAHVQALKFLGIPYDRRTGRAKDPHIQVSVYDLMRVMMRFSDSAAPDYLWFRLGSEYFYRILGDYGIKNTIIDTLLGSYLCFLESDPVWEDSARLAQLFLHDETWRTQALTTGLKNIPGYDDQVRIALATDSMSTVNDLLQLYRMISDLNPDPVMRIMQEILEFTKTGNEKVHIGGKGGCLPSIISNVIYIRQGETHQQGVGILLTKELPKAIWEKELRHCEQQIWINETLHNREIFTQNNK